MDVRLNMYWVAMPNGSGPLTEKQFEGKTIGFRLNFV